MSPYGLELKRRREAIGATREALGAAAGISASTVRQIEAGSIKRPPLKRLEGFASLLGWSVAEQLALLGEAPLPVLQRVILAGRVCQEPVKRERPDGRQFVSFSIRVSGEPWLIKSYRGLDEISALRSGQAVWVEGMQGAEGSGVLADTVAMLPEAV